MVRDAASRLLTMRGSKRLSPTESFVSEICANAFGTRGDVSLGLKADGHAAALARCFVDSGWKNHENRRFEETLRMTDGLRVTSDGRIARIVFDDAENRNLILSEWLIELSAVAARLADDPLLQVLTITGAGLDWFSAGLLTPDLRASLGKPRVLERVRLANRTFDAIEALPQVVIMGFNGHVRAGAVELALVGDYRIAADHATLACPEAKWGGFPGAGGPVRMAALIGAGHALDLLCTSREIDAAEMKAMGLVERVVPKADLHDQVEAMAQAIAANGPLATQGAKRILRMRQNAGSKAARDLSDALRQALEWSADVDEGIGAQLDGRTPRFIGR